MTSDSTTPQGSRSQHLGSPSQVEIQPAPALQAAVSEQPDYGEMSYRSSGRLASRKALVILVEQASERLGRLAILVNNAGRMGKTGGRIHHQPYEHAGIGNIFDYAIYQGCRCEL